MKIWWKRLIVAGLLLCLSLTGCQKEEMMIPEAELPEDPVKVEQEESAPEEEVVTEPEIQPLSDLQAEISWWTYPVFVQDLGMPEGTYEQQIIEEFQKYYPGIQVQLEMLDYETGPARVEEAIAAGAAPDVLFDEPGRINGYAKKGVLADLQGLFTEEYRSDLVNGQILTACMHGEQYVMYPLSMANYVMAFNRQMLETCGAMELLNLDGARGWDTAAFIQVLEKLNQSGFQAGSMHCSGVSGDYATRSFLTNLYDSSFMNESLSAYTFEGDRAVSALNQVKEWNEKEWIRNGSDMTGAGVVQAFANGETAYTLLWSLPHAIANEERLKEHGIDVVEVPYPSQDGTPVLEYMINGFCVFDSKDEARLQAAQYLLDFIGSGEQAAAHVARTGAVSVRGSLKDVYQGNEQALFYEAVSAYSGPYYQKVKGFESMRVYWYQMIDEVLSGEYGAKASVEGFHKYANETLKGE